MSPIRRVLLLLIAIVPLMGCQTSPATGDRFFSPISWQQEAALGLQAAPGFTEQFGGPIPDENIRRYVSEVGFSMVPHVEEGVPDDLPWEFQILNSDVLNAFALPGGQVFITRGLASRLTSEAQLAGVLGHEIGHVTDRHGNERLANAQLLQIAIAGAAIAVGVSDEDSAFSRYGQLGVPALQVGGQLVLLQYGREDELTADMLGMRYMARAGYKPSGQLEVMKVLGSMSAGAARPPEFLSTHPYPEARIARIEQLLQTDFAEAQASEATYRRPARYQERMLRPLAALPPAPPPSAAPSGEGASLGPPVLWCAVCRVDDDPPRTLADRWSARLSGGHAGGQATPSSAAQLPPAKPAS
ncbi:MAG: M48 family metalloprotease [Planctomycetota bacterium]